MSYNNYEARLAKQREDWLKKQATEKLLREKRRIELMQKYSQKRTACDPGVYEEAPSQHQSLLSRVAQDFFQNESSARKQEVANEIESYYKDERDDIFFSIADQALNKAIAEDIDNHLKNLVSLTDEHGEIGEIEFSHKVVDPVIQSAREILQRFENMYKADRQRIAELILSNPEYRTSIIRLVKEKFEKYIELFSARNVNITEIYTKIPFINSGIEYENYVEDIFNKFGWSVYRTPASGDQGADLVCEKSGFKLVVQCKFYSGNVGNAAVQEVYAAVGFYGANHGAVVSNASFTSSAISLAEKLGILLVANEQLDQFAQG